MTGKMKLLVMTLLLSSSYGGEIKFTGIPSTKESVIVTRGNPIYELLGEKSFKDPVYSLIEESFPPQREGQGESPEKVLERLEKKIEEQLRFRSGDDVGNGGDILRSKLMADIKELASYLSVKMPTTENLLIVSSLGSPFAHKNHKGVDLILLDKEIWTKAYNEGLDVRALLLQVLVPGHKNMLGLYQSLEPKYGRPFCYFDFSSDLVLKESQDFKAEDKSDAQKAVDEAFSACEQAKLIGCHKIGQEYSGLFGNNKHRVTVRGYKIGPKKLSGQEKREIACRAAIMCEELTFAAPFNQVSPADFDVVSQAVSHFCQ